MKKSIVSVLMTGVVSFMILGLSFCNSEAASPAEETTATNEKKELSSDELLKRGDYLINTGGCDDCHSPKTFGPEGPVPDMTKRFSGTPADVKLPPVDPKATQPGGWMLFSPDLTVAVGPWGISYSANLTPDSATGIGAWTEDMFIQALRKGKHMGQDGGRPIMPPMPWPSIGKHTDEDLKAMFAYLKSQTAISNRVPAPVPPTEVGKK
jgi:hypothetical protein